MRSVAAVLIIVLGTLLTTIARAEKPAFGDTLTIAIGGMNTQADTSVASTRAGFRKTELDLDDLGMDNHAKRLWAGVNWQIADRWRLGLSYNSFKSAGDWVPKGSRS